MVVKKFLKLVYVVSKCLIILILLDFFYYVRNKDVLYYLYVVMIYKYEIWMFFREYIYKLYVFDLSLNFKKNMICMYIFFFFK